MEPKYSGTILSGALALSVGMLPDQFAGYALKVVSVLVLAIVAELGKRLVGKFWKVK